MGWVPPRATARSSFPISEIWPELTWEPGIRSDAFESRSNWMMLFETHCLESRIRIDVNLAKSSRSRIIQMDEISEILSKILFARLNDPNGANRPQEKRYKFALSANSQFLEEMPQMSARRSPANRKFFANFIQMAALHEQA